MVGATSSEGFSCFLTVLLHEKRFQLVSFTRRVHTMYQPFQRHARVSKI